MKYRFLLISLAALAVSCSVEEVKSPELEDPNAPVFYATIDEQPDADTKVYADDQLRVLWNADDRITIFNKYTYGYEYYFKGEDGDTAGAFGKVPNDDFVSGNTLDMVYAVYPHSNETKIDNDGIITLTLPAEQTYKDSSFGIGANTMVSKTTDNQLRFKNVGGYLSLKFFGEGVSISSITLKGNNGELLAGKCSIDMSSGLPVLTMDEGKATDTISLVCDPAVDLGNSSSEAIAFWFVLPPVTFSNGITVTVTTSDGGVFEKSTSNKLEIGRSAITKLGALEVVPNYDSVFVQFEDENFKAYCIENFDTDGDGEISYEEAMSVTEISLSPTNEYNLQSLQGIEYMPNLEVIDCWGEWYDTDNKSNGINREHYYVGPYSDNWDYAWGPIGTLRYLDVSNNPRLRILNIYNNSALGEDVVQLSLADNPDLEELRLGMTWMEYPNLSSNQKLKIIDFTHLRGTVPDFSGLTNVSELVMDYPQDGSDYIDLDVSNMKDLEILHVDARVGSLSDLSNNPKLKGLNINHCNAFPSTLDLSSNPALEELECEYTYRTSLDLSHNPLLQRLRCLNNQISELSLTNNTNLIYLDCRGNQLATLDVSNNLLLEELYCSPMKDEDENNILSILYVSENQAIPFVTEDRNEGHIPAGTEIRIVSDGSGGDDPTPISFNVGDIINSDGLGIVCWVSSDGQSALFMSVTELQNKNWKTSNNWCMSYGESWRMPTIDELTEIHSNFNLINTRLLENGYTTLTTANKCYWSSTVNPMNSSYYYRERLHDGTVFTNIGNDEINTSTANYTRAVKIVSNGVPSSVSVESVGLSASQMTLEIGQVKQLFATVYPENATDKTVVWSSSDSSIASVDEAGRVMAQSAGIVIITAESGGVKATCKITVVVPVSSIELSTTSVTINVGSELQLSATVLPSNATNKTVVWSSSDQSLAKVNNKGVVSGISPGVATITAKTGALVATCVVTVFMPVSRIVLDRSSVVLSIGESLKLSSMVIPLNASSASVEWSSNNPDVALVNGNGVVTSISSGEAIVTASAGGKSVSCYVNVSTFGNDVIPDNEIWYTSTDGNIVSPSISNTSYCFGAKVISNTYQDGKGVIVFSGDVTTIGENAFQYRSKLKEITLPNTVTKIGNYAFDLCTGLRIIKLNDGIMNIGNYVFKDCSNLRSITVPDGITELGDYVFKNCSSLQEVKINGPSSTSWSTEFVGCNSIVDVSLGDFFNSYSLPEVFVDSKQSIVSVTLLEGVTSSVMEAFRGCNPSTIVFPCSFSYINGDILWGCNVAYVTFLSDIPPTKGKAPTRLYINQANVEYVFVPPSSVIDYRNWWTWQPPRADLFQPIQD